MFNHVSLAPPDAIFGLSEGLNYWKVGKLEA